MSNENVYETPQSDLTTDTRIDHQLASRWARLGAALLDTIVMMLIIAPILTFQGYYDKIFSGVEPSLTENLMAGLFGIVVFFLVNLAFLLKNGQTIGKKLVGIKIVDLSGNKINLKRHILPRYAVYLLPGQVPLFGQLFSIVNILFIFGSEKRCIHDYAANTKVISC